MIKFVNVRVYSIDWEKEDPEQILPKQLDLRFLMSNPDPRSAKFHDRLFDHIMAHLENNYGSAGSFEYSIVR